VIAQWGMEYNTRRPHSGLGYSPLVLPNLVSQVLAVMWTLSAALVQKLHPVMRASLLI
jgi:transposase InsO family protein